MRWADLNGYSADAFLISHVGWWPDSSAAYCYVQDRTQTWLDLVKIAAADASPKAQRLFRDTTKAWIADQEPITFLKDGSFLWTSERDGWKHLYHYAADGTLKGQVTAGRVGSPLDRSRRSRIGLDLLHGDPRRPDGDEPLPGEARADRSSGSRRGRAATR